MVRLKLAKNPTMLPLRLPYRSTIATVLLSVAFAVTANGGQTVTVSDANLGNEEETWEREVPAQVKQGQEMKGATRLVAQRQQRIALVIGNGDYQEDPLDNPVNDATDVAKALRELDFEVILLKNKALREMEEAIEDFSRKLRQGGVGVFYYAGHGVQVGGENYLVPLKAQLNRQKDVRYEAVPLGKVLNAMEEAETQVNIIIIDACRDNPFYRRWRSVRRGSGSVRGLAPVQSARGTLIAFATAPGEFAEDGEGENSPFTSHLLRHIKTPNLPVELMFKKVRAAVVAETNREQTPWEQSSLVGEFSFKPIQEQRTPPPQSNPSSTTAAITQPIPSSPSTPASQPGTTLISKATGVNYAKLRDLLEAGEWKEADIETTRAMLQAANREKEGWFGKEDIENFSCEDLRIIDQLWRESSQGKFGFRVQKEIWQSNGSPTIDSPIENWRKFYIEVGWKTEESGIESSGGYVSYHNLGAFKDINLSRRGNLPYGAGDIFMVGGSMVGRGDIVWLRRRILFSRCELEPVRYNNFRQFVKLNL
ncbi:MAG: GUN4 domain-containing protein [Xenococcaceae cyanobacterium MO_234.B1]|nr:GUN4 domain-containing protein [Xenococcaceae cyanobacterium MO_234.B1]